MRFGSSRWWAVHKRSCLLLLTLVALACTLIVIGQPLLLRIRGDMPAPPNAIISATPTQIVPTTTPPSLSLPPQRGARPTPTIPKRVATPTPTKSTSAASPSKQAMPVGNLPGWKQIFREDFTTDVPIGSFPGSVYGKKFTVYDDGTPDTAGKEGSPSRYYPSKVVSVRGGLLNLYLHTENGTPMAAALLPVLNYDHLYGKYTIRFRSDALKGYKTAWLLWPDSEEWPQDGEIDFPEGNLNETINAFMHRQDGKSGSDQDAYETEVTYTSWHTASLEWTPEKVNFILDGQVIGTSTKRIPNTPMQWVIQTESCLNGCPSPGTEGNLQIDWAVAYVLG